MSHGEQAPICINSNWMGSSTLSEEGTFSRYVVLGRLHPGHCAQLQVLQSQGDKLKLGSGRRDKMIPCGQTSKGLGRSKEVNLLGLQGRQGSTLEIFQQQSEGDRNNNSQTKNILFIYDLFQSKKKGGKPGNPMLRFFLIIKVTSMYCKVCKSSYDQNHLTLLPFLEKTLEYLEYEMLRITAVLLS